MMDELVCEAGAGTITAVNEAVKMGKLVQIAAGCAYAADGSLLHIKADARVKELMRIIEASEGKVIVFIPLTGALQSVASEVSKVWKTEVVYGDVSKSERDRIFSDFKTDFGAHVIVAHPKCMAHGLSLTIASTIVWFIPTNNPSDYQQANCRIHRPGQTKNTYIIHLQGSDIERRMYTTLKTKGTVQGCLLELIKKVD
jgi:SNF2 family DNA or RNA helicase